MARRKKKGSNERQVLFVVALVIGFFLLLQHPTQTSNPAESDSSFSLFFILLVAVIVLLFVFRRNWRNKLRESLIAKAQYKINEKIADLARKRAQLVQSDSYGKPQLGRWPNEIDYFIDQHIVPMLTRDERAMLDEQRATITSFLENRVQIEIGNQQVFREFSPEMSPAEFEVFCAEELRRCGCATRVTGQSRDQGVDVIAEKKDMRVVLQCKLYTNPVGNKAVQEVVAARAHEQASYGVVITNNTYTQAAKQLAFTNNVWLLHYMDLQRLDNILRSKR